MQCHNEWKNNKQGLVFFQFYTNINLGSAELKNHFSTFVAELNFLFKYNQLNIAVNRWASMLRQVTFSCPRSGVGCRLETLHLRLTPTNIQPQLPLPGPLTCKQQRFLNLHRQRHYCPSSLTSKPWSSPVLLNSCV